LPNIEYRGHVTLPVEPHNHIVKSNNCDCSIDGDGSADKPMFIRYCVAHSAGYGLFALWEDKQTDSKAETVVADYYNRNR
jgi:hypothetical protein